MSELVKLTRKQIGGEEVNAVSARELHAKLQVGRDFSTWIRDRIEKYDFIEGSDYALPKSGELESSGFQKPVEYFLSLDMAKELSMVENNPQGRVAHRYFIDCERKMRNPLLDPEKVLEALRYYAAVKIYTTGVGLSAFAVVQKVHGVDLSQFSDKQPAIAEPIYSFGEASDILGITETELRERLAKKGFITLLSMGRVSITDRGADFFRHRGNKVHLSSALLRSLQ